ncbi:hypothetical protein F3J45_14040 [Pantoea sp. Ap-967]|uniref:hypothetical protein n=1 Tax=Pantoea sp. Ap-967 TaxID=2608362 RepID=UPI0014241C90|nr:hypothetical protein [Pantoea sp. Ap-967]NIE75556.1 hypothetical protein [Pantoea sp. Ap-967]
MTGSYCTALQDVVHFRFSTVQAYKLDKASRHLSRLGGPDAPGSADLSIHYAFDLKNYLTTAQLSQLSAFIDGKVCAIDFSSMLPLRTDPVPDSLPPIDELAHAPETIYLASRHQVLLGLVGYRSFAFDIDNDAKQLRLVANFKGGGERPLVHEAPHQPAELSSHAGVCLGPHTEPPYNCSVVAEGGHSPAPSALILTARWNPQGEPTRLTPMRPVIAKLNGLEALALSSRSYRFSRSECFIKDDSPPPAASSILQFDGHFGYTLRYSTYRYSLDNHAVPHAKKALHTLRRLITQVEACTYTLDSSSALLINNSQALHGRDIIQDNRRLLIRLFAYSPQTEPLVLHSDPLVVRG